MDSIAYFEICNIVSQSQSSILKWLRHQDPAKLAAMMLQVIRKFIDKSQ